MPIANRDHPHRIQWPLTPTQVEWMDDMFDRLFRGQHAVATVAGESIVTGEIPTGTVDGSNTLFYTAANYSGLTVYLNGVRQRITDDYTETYANAFTFVTAPTTGDVVTVDYGVASGVSVPTPAGAGAASSVRGSTQVSGQALSRVNDINVTLTFTSGTPLTALLRSVEMTLGWLGQLGLDRGGTNASMTPVNGGLVYSTGSALAIGAAGSIGQIVRSGGAGAPTWSTATYPATAATSGAYLRADGTNWITSTLTLPNAASTGDLPYATGANTLGMRTIGSTGETLTVSGGVPVWAPTVAATTTITDDTTTNATMYPAWVTASSGNLPLKVTSTKLTFNPSTGTLTTGPLSATTGTFSSTLDVTGTSALGDVATLTRALAANTGGDGYVARNTMAATSGNQRYSPRVHWTGQGWKTDATAASEAVDAIAELRPVQGAAHPAGLLVWAGAINGGSYADLLSVGFSNAISTTVTVTQATAGTGNFSRLALANDNGSRGFITVLSSTFTTAAFNKADGLAIAATGTGGMAIASTNASADIDIYTANVIRGKFSRGGNWVFGALATDPSSGSAGVVFQDATAFSGMASGTAGLYGDNDGTTTSVFGISQSGVITQLSGKLGYATSAGGTVTQSTSKATAFTLSKVTGQITTAADALGADTSVSSTWTNTTIAATDIVAISHVSGGTVGAYAFNVACGAGSATLTITNRSTGSLSEALVLGFVVLKGVTS